MASATTSQFSSNSNSSSITGGSSSGVMIVANRNENQTPVAIARLRKGDGGNGNLFFYFLLHNGCHALLTTQGGYKSRLWWWIWTFRGIGCLAGNVFLCRVVLSLHLQTWRVVSRHVGDMSSVMSPTRRHCMSARVSKRLTPSRPDHHGGLDGRR
jgi:hypothetical protein